MEDFTENSVDNLSFCFEDSGRGCRNKKRQADPTCCPVCSLTIRESDMSTHLSTELDKLNKIPCSKVRVNGNTNKNSPSSSSSSSNGSNNGDANQDKNWETYQKVRSNRQNRQRTKTRKRKAEDTCPICNKEVSEDLTLHVEVCLRKSEADGSDDENIDIESFEEYEWAGQSRVRATSMLSGGVSSLGTSLTNTEEDEDLNVDGDDTQTFGAPQYSERDIILPCGGPEDIALRKAVIGSDPKRLNSDDKNHMKFETSGDPILEVLKNRIRELEARLDNKQEVFKCLICMERYHTPVISVCCWHVHCEQCWLQTLGAKKLCPQCNMITSPADLRRIYM